LFESRLRDEDTVEWIAVNHRQQGDFQRVLARDRQLGVAVLQQLLAKDARVGGKAAATSR
jgi:hypothetical protein